MSQHDLVIRNGTVVTAADTVGCDIGITDGVVVALHSQLTSGFLGDNVFLQDGLNVLYWLVPHQLTSDAPRELVRAELELFSSDQTSAADLARAVASVPGASGAADIVWWAFLVALMATLVYVAVRRRQV